MSHCLLDALPIHHRIARRLAACTGCRWHSKQGHLRAVHLQRLRDERGIERGLALVRQYGALDTLGHVDGAAASDREQSVTALASKEINAGTDFFKLGIGRKAVRLDQFYVW